MQLYDLDGDGTISADEFLVLNCVKDRLQQRRAETLQVYGEDRYGESHAAIVQKRFQAQIDALSEFVPKIKVDSCAFSSVSTAAAHVQRHGQ